jgi:hypothetical protein
MIYVTTGFDEGKAMNRYPFSGCSFTGALVAGLAAAFVLAGAPDESRAAAVTPPAGNDTIQVVDCLLPGQLRRLGPDLTYLTPRRPARASAAGCLERGGEITVSDRDHYTSLR